MSQPDFENLLREAIGLDVASIGNSALERAVKSRMASLRMEQSQCYWDYVQGSTGELQELIESIVVPETWFFRDREAFPVMVRLVSQSWLALPNIAPMRILSVPCCTGEEPYSIAIALVEAGLAPSQLQVDAVDVSRQAIVRARRGTYGLNSFRGEDLGFRDRYLERSGKVYRVPHWLRSLVTFHHENLFSPSFRLGALPYDIIFCRNVLIYFDRAKQEAVLATLNRLLKDDGYLFVGPAEAVLASRNGFRPLNETMSFAFSNGETIALPKERTAQPSLETDRKVSRPTSSKLTPTVADEISALPKSREGSKSANVVDIDQIRRLADAGQLDEAAVLCEMYIDRKGRASDVYYLLALIKDARGESERAMDCYRKVLYLDPNHSDALMHLAFLYERQGNLPFAKRLRDRARRSTATAIPNRSASETAARRAR